MRVVYISGGFSCFVYPIFNAFFKAMVHTVTQACSHEGHSGALLPQILLCLPKLYCSQKKRVLNI